MNEAVKDPAGTLLPPGSFDGWTAITCGMLMAAILIFIPPSWPALSYFDPPKRLMVAFLALALIAKRRVDSRHATFDAPDLAVLMLLGWIAVRAIFRPNPWSEWVVVANWMLPVLVFLGARGASPSLLLPACRTLSVLGVAEAFLMLLQHSGFDPLFGFTTEAISYRPGRMLGTVGYQNQAVDLLAIGVFASCLGFRSVMLRLLVIVPMAIAIALSAHRGGILAISVAAAVAGWRLPAGLLRRLARAAGVTLFALVCWFIAPRETRDRFLSVVRSPGTDVALQSRLHMARAAVDLFASHPLAGAGPGAYAHAYMELLARRLPDQKQHHLLDTVVYAREAHQDWLQFPAEFGLVGLGLGIAVVLLLHRTATLGECSPRKRAVRTGLGFYMGIAATTSFAWQTALGAPLAALLLGLLWPSRGGHSRPAVVASRIWVLPLAMGLSAIAWTALDLTWTIRADRAARQGSLVVANRVPPWGHVYFARFGAEAAHLQHWMEAVRWLETAWEGHRDPALLSNLAQTYGHLGRWAEAEKLYRLWVQCGIQHERALHDWSLSLEALGRYADAADTEQRRLELWPPQPSFPYLRVAALHLKDQAPDRALAYLQRRYPGAAAKRDRPGAKFLEGELRLFNLIAAAWIMKNDGERARPWIAAVLRQEPTNQVALANSTLLDATPWTSSSAPASP